MSIASAMSETPAAKKQHRVLVKCGGFSTQLAKIVGEKVDGDPLWGSRFDAKNPKAVVQTHLEFLKNGAQIILSNTYQSSIEGFMLHLNLSREESIQLMRKSVQLAKEAKQMYLSSMKDAENESELSLPLIMASIGPYGAHLHDGSEYNGSYADRISVEEIQNWHRPRIEACLAEGVDGLAIETIPCLMEAEAVVDMVLRDYPDVKFWVSFQCKDEKSLAHGDLFADAVASIWKRVSAQNACERCIAIGVNCVNPMFVSSLFKSARQDSVSSERIPFVVYSNRGEIYDADTGEWMGRESCIPLETFVPEWIELGARIIGGCCRVYSADIQRIRNCIDDLENSNCALKMSQ